MNRNANGPAVKDKDFYTEQEAAEALGISVTRLRMLLDQNVFNDGGSRPRDIEITAADLLLLRFWHRSTPSPKVVIMPKRRG
jgi:hypothetical protein